MVEQARLQVVTNDTVSYPPNIEQKRAVSLRIGLRNIVEDSYKKSTTSQDLIERSIDRWQTAYPALNGFSEAYAGITDRLRNTYPVINEDQMMQWQLDTIGVPRDVFIKVSTGNALQLVAEHIIAGSMRVHEGDIVEAQIDNQDRSLLDSSNEEATINILQSDKEWLLAAEANGTKFLADDEYGATLAGFVAAFMYTATSMPPANRLQNAYFLSTMRTDEAYYHKAAKSSYVGTGRRRRKGLDDAVNVYDFANTLVSFAHEKTHAEQGDYLWLVKEVDAINGEILSIADVLDAGGQGLFDEFSPDVDSLLYPLTTIQKQAMRQCRNMIERATTPPISRQLVTDHNIEYTKISIKHVLAMKHFEKIATNFEANE